jgi:WD40 repeat protein
VLCTWTASPDEVKHWTAPADRRWVASAGQARTVTLWNPLTGATLATFTSSTAGVTALATPPDGSWLAVAGRNRVIEIVDSVSRNAVRSLELRTGYATKLAASPDGRLLAVAGRRKSVEVWNVHSGQLQSVLTADSGGWAAVLADGSYRMEGTPSDIWWTAGLCRFEADEIDEIAAYVPELRRLP